ncbi:sensor histidine kinase [Modicisalibacter xianhensis]|uniref:histidine kinase n=2 Tax=Modicisalibacter xianhensis TaxID=442341 RepID=A0A1I3AQ22_9GAMM|nr:HAMP domain-containing sensor histidine kinase [Halomonas xianhensis]TDX29856.1 two-component system sensor histidine kinase GlrK [Halomonas xianhensis]SFH52268.1 two-component system, NtrC family, sensor histidine kinase GlrK [Halomonas xianhensis]
MTLTLFLHRTVIMTSQVSRRWRPRSLLQLVLLAFLVVMLPIAVLMFQAGQALSELSMLADISARQAVEQTRRARELSNLALEMERSARQYAVVEQPGLMDIYSAKLDEFATLLDAQQRLLPDNRDILALQAQLQSLSDLPTLSTEEIAQRLGEFASFAERTSAVRDATNLYIDNRIEGISAQASEVRQRLWLQTAALVSASLALMLLFTWLIIRPIRQIERRILNLGTGVEPASAQLIQGPAELVNLGERIDWLSARLAELEAQKQQFLRHMSHELKTPLASVREGTSLLSDGVAGELTSRQLEIVELIDTSGLELQRLIEQLLDYNLLQHNQVIGNDIFDVSVLLQDVINKHRLALDKKGMRVSVSALPIDWSADRDRTARIIDNLVSNAIAYGEDGGQLEVRAYHRGPTLAIEVANSGEPIDAADRDRLFEAFYQGRARRKGAIKGSGIGLSVAADCARAQHGQLMLVDDDAMAVCFRLTLPWNGEGGSDNEKRLGYATPTLSTDRTYARN